jgi:hypothetical protein
MLNPVSRCTIKTAGVSSSLNTGGHIYRRSLRFHSSKPGALGSGTLENYLSATGSPTLECLPQRPISSYQLQNPYISNKWQLERGGVGSSVPHTLGLCNVTPEGVRGCSGTRRVCLSGASSSETCMTFSPAHPGLGWFLVLVRTKAHFWTTLLLTDHVNNCLRSQSQSKVEVGFESSSSAPYTLPLNKSPLNSSPKADKCCESCPNSTWRMRKEKRILCEVRRKRLTAQIRIWCAYLHSELRPEVES